jgi:DNA-binding CsgD family transcriptional regulator
LRILTLTVIGLVHARRGDRDPWPVLDEAGVLAGGQSELQYRVPVAAARAEAAWLAGDRAGVDAATRDVLGEALRHGASWVSGELAWLRHLAGLPTPPAPDTAESPAAPPHTAGLSAVPPGHGRPAEAAGPYARQLCGEADAAAEEWTRLGCPYDAALALAAATDEPGLRRALAGFQRLGARPAVTVVTRRLRERGVLGIPRGPQTRTRANPADLTRREVEVLALLREGLSNVEIAGKLFVSTKTVSHHVSAILRKLGVTRRGQAAAQAARLDLPTASQT